MYTQNDLKYVNYQLEDNAKRIVMLENLVEKTTAYFDKLKVYSEIYKLYQERQALSYLRSKIKRSQSKFKNHLMVEVMQ